MAGWQAYLRGKPWDIGFVHFGKPEGWALPIFPVVRIVRTLRERVVVGTDVGSDVETAVLSAIGIVVAGFACAELTPRGWLGIVTAPKCQGCRS